MRTVRAAILIMAICGLTPSSDARDNLPRWRYGAETDKMRGLSLRKAELLSVNQVKLGFPYHGGRATLLVLDRPQGFAATYLGVDGQFACHSETEGYVSIKFDDGPIERVECDQAGSGMSHWISLSTGAPLIPRIKAAHVMTIEAEFFGAGLRQIEFHTDGLTWDPINRDKSIPY